MMLRQERLVELEGRMTTKEKELQRLKAELGAIDSDRARTEEEKKKMRAAFEEKAEAVQRQMLQLQKQLKDGEAAKVSQGLITPLIKIRVISNQIWSTDKSVFQSQVNHCPKPLRGFVELRLMEFLYLTSTCLLWVAQPVLVIQELHQ